MSAPHFMNVRIGGRRRVEDRHLVLLDDLPPAALVRGVGGALVHHLRGAVGERSVDDVGVAGDPADVGGAPVDVGLGVHVVDDRVRVGRLGEVAAGRVEDALRLPGRARGVEDEERVLGLEAAAPRAVGVGRVERVVPPDVARRSTRSSWPVRLTTSTCSTDVSPWSSGGVDGRLEGRGRAAAVAAVGGDDELASASSMREWQRLGGEPAEDDGVRRADPGAGEHRDGGLGDHRQVDRDACRPCRRRGRLEGVGRALAPRRAGRRT